MPADAHARWPNYQEADFILKDYAFASGETLPELKLHYRTIGIPQRNAGGKIINGPMEVPGGSWIVQCKDPQGAMFALVGPRT